MTLLEVRNYTYYNTDDLIAVVEAVEAYLRKGEGGGALQTAWKTSWRHDDGRIDPVVAFKDYGTAKTYRNTAFYDEASRCTRHANSRIYVKLNNRWGPPKKGEVRIIPPSKLWLDPLEQIAACKDGGDTLLPSEAVAQIVSLLVTFYSEGRVSLDERATAGRKIVAQGLTVRVMPKRAAKVTTTERHRVALADATDSWSDVRYRLKRTQEEARRSAEHHSSAMNRLRRSKVTLTPEMIMMDEKLSEALRCVDTAYEALRALLSDLGVPSNEKE